MKNLEFEIKRLKEEGFSYNLIASTLGCSKGTVSYHLGTGQKAKAKSRAYLKREDLKIKSRTHRRYSQEFIQRYKRLCGCLDCGIKNPTVLQFDHINPELKITSVAQMLSDRYSLKVIKEEIRKCRVVCANCHLIRTSVQFNYFKI